MIIVSQDKMQTTESLELRIDCITEEKGEFPCIETKIVGAYIADRKYGTLLGEYKTKERAKEVLQEIIEHHHSLRKNMVYAEGDAEFIFDTRFYYEMPED